jgi:RHS repeat-associated protein
VTITGSNFGTTLGSSFALLNGVAMTVNSWNNTSISATVPTGATSGHLVVIVDPSMNVSNPVNFTVTNYPLPSTWLDQDVGAVGITGSATYSDGTYTVNGAGGGITGTTDAFHFAYEPLSGDGTIVARVVSLSSVQYAGVMIRNSLSSNDMNACVCFHSSSTLQFDYRLTAGGTESQPSTGSGVAVARYSQELNIDEPVAMLRSGATSYYDADGLGSVTSLANGSGTLTQSYTYDSFGNVTASSGSITNPFQYTGRELDSETGLYYYRARYNDPTIGRFVSEDPLQFGSGDSNFYNYVAQNPVNYTDPTGRFRIPGTNWCGPDWTGGLVEEYRPDHSAIYKNPLGPEDEVCKHHDICYFNARSSSPCDPVGRSHAMAKCDLIFVGEMPNTAFGYGLSAGIYLHHFLPDAGPNSNTCPSCNSGPPKDLLLTVGVPHALP